MTDSHRSVRQPTPPLAAANGFSLIEMVVSMVIFSVGALGFAGTSVVLERQLTLAAIESDRSAAMISAMERVRALPFDSLRTGVDSTGTYALHRTVTPLGLYTKEVRVITSGPGRAMSAAGGVTIHPNVADTFEYQVIKP